MCGKRRERERTRGGGPAPKIKNLYVAGSADIVTGRHIWTGNAVTVQLCVAVCRIMSEYNEQEKIVIVYSYDSKPLPCWWVLQQDIFLFNVYLTRTCLEILNLFYNILNTPVIAVNRLYGVCTSDTNIIAYCHLESGQTAATIKEDGWTAWDEGWIWWPGWVRAVWSCGEEKQTHTHTQNRKFCFCEINIFSLPCWLGHD